jgi:hypothetical protein
MSCAQTTGPIQHHLDAYSTTVAYFWFTSYFPCTGLDFLKAVWKARVVTGNFQCQPAVQLVSVRIDKPDSPAAVATTLVGAGETCTGVVNVSADTDDKLYMRCGIAYSLTSGTTMGSADVTLEVTYESCGSMVGVLNDQYYATSTTSVAKPISKFLSALAAQKIKLGVIVSGLTGNIQWRPVWRKATTSTETPGAWTTTASWRNTNNVEVNTGELDLSDASDMYVQVGIEVSLSSGSTPAEVNLTTILAIRS